MAGSLARALSEARRRMRARAHRRTFAWVLLTFTMVVALVGLAASWQHAPSGTLVVERVDALDTDGDGVPDVYENAFLGTDPNVVAPAGRLPDAWIRAFDLDPGDLELANRTAALPSSNETPEVYVPRELPAAFRMTFRSVYAVGRPADWSETEDGAWSSGLDPRAWDVDGSRVPYGWLIAFGIDPFDRDALDRVAQDSEVDWTPREAYERGLHPRLVDGDQDGLDDGRERALGADPLQFSTGGSGIADGWLVRHGLDLLDPSVPYQDPDRDGLSNLDEFRASLRWDAAGTLTGGGLDPNRLSSTGSPIPDGWLVRFDLDPLDAGGASRVTTRDNDTGAVLTVFDEYRVNRPPSWDEAKFGPWFGGSDPTLDDTDGDGLPDLLEIKGWPSRVAGARRLFSDPTRVDTDGDGLPDAAEFAGVFEGRVFPPTDPQARDTDFDGLTDGEEIGAVPWRGIMFTGLDPTREDTDEDGLRDGDEAVYWFTRHERSTPLAARYEWGPDPRPSARDVFAGMGPPGADALAALRPDGDADGDGFANIVDPDSDGDGLLDGWEVIPRSYQESPFASERERSATDPARNDTDLDGLPDAWEVANARYDTALGGWNLDAALWSSFHDDVSDADRDLDDDGAVWYSFHRVGAAMRAERHVFPGSNLAEFNAGSDPNRPSSSPDGLRDGWKIFWGTIYLALAPEDRGDVYPGAPGPFTIPFNVQPPTIGADDARVLARLQYARFVLKTQPTLSFGERVDPTFQSTSSTRILGDIAYSMASTAGNATNPYLLDTDGDGASDAWESVWAILARDGASLSPVAFDSGDDPDSDGVPNLDEFRGLMDPFEPDSDFGGADDRLERLLGLDALDPADDARALDAGEDSDGDGVADSAEVLGRPVGVDGRRVITDPRDPDSDHDGLLDGQALSVVLGRSLNTANEIDRGIIASFAARGLVIVLQGAGSADIMGEETVGADPTRVSSAGDGVPDGWRVLYGLSPTTPSPHASAYAFGRPSWWNESAHGIWRWGLAPNAMASRDHDSDGLDDRNGEDPIPFANQGNLLVRGDPRDAFLSPLERLERGQAFGDDPASRARTLPPRVETRITLDPLPELVRADGSTSFTGHVSTVHGEPVPNATVILALGSRDVTIGAAVSDTMGGFEGRVILARALDAPPGSEGVVMFGARDGLGVHANRESSLLAVGEGRARVFAWTYNTSTYSPLRQRVSFTTPDGVIAVGALSASSAPQDLDLALPASLKIDAPEVVSTDASIPVNVTLTDGLARPLSARRVIVAGHPVTTDQAGHARVILPPVKARGPFAIDAYFAGEVPRHLEARVSSTVAVVATPRLVIVAPPFTIHPGESFRASGSLVADTRGVPGARVGVASFGNVVSVETLRDGSFDLLVAVPRSASPGRLIVSAAYEGNSSLKAASSTAVVMIAGEPRWDVTGHVAHLGERLMVSARLFDANGRALAERESVLQDSDGVEIGRGRTLDTGRVTFPLVASGPVGERMLRVVFQDANEGTASKSFPFTVVTDTRITLDAAEFLRGRPARVRGHLVDESGAGVPGARVEVFAGLARAESVTAEDGGFAVEVDLGVDTRPGLVTTTAFFAGAADGTMSPSEASARVRLRDRALVTLDARHVPLVRPTLAGQVRTLAGGPLAGSSLDLEGPWGVVSASADREGRFVIALPLPSDTRVGPLVVTTTIAESDVVERARDAFTIAVVDTGALSFAPPARARPGEFLTAPFTLSDSRGRAIDASDASYALRLNGITLAASRDGSVIRFRLPSDAPVGRQNLSLELVSDSVVTPPAVRSIAIVEDAVVTAVAAEGSVSGGSGRFVTRLAQGDAPIANATVFLVRAGEVPLRATTDREGRAVFHVPFIDPNASGYTLVFEGSDTLAPAAAEIRLHVAAVGAPAGPTGASPLVVGAVAGLLLLAGGVLAAAMVRRRRASPVAALILQDASRRLVSRRADVRVLYETYVALLSVLGLNEDDAESLTLGDLVSRLTGGARAAEADALLLTDVFNEAVYAPHLLETGRILRAARALDRIAEGLRAAPTTEGVR